MQPCSHKYGHLWVVIFGASDLAWALVMGGSLTLLLAGYILLSRGWRQVHGAQGRLFTDGSYSYARHPQYTGLFLVITGFLVQWPTLLTVLMAPILVYAYVRLARAEERYLLGRFGDRYADYLHRVPAFFPHWRKWKAFLTTPVPEASGKGEPD